MPSAFRLCLNRKTFEYDIYNLIRSFFPFSEITIWYAGEEKPGGKYDADFTVTYSDDSVSFSCEREPGGSGLFQADVGRRCGSADTGAGRGSADTGAGHEKGDAATPVTAVITDWSDRARTKNEVKRLIYSYLSGITGKELPWGDLTGIRPSKIVMNLAEAGLDDEGIMKAMRESYFVSSRKAALVTETVRREENILRRAFPESRTGDNNSINPGSGYSLYVGIPFCPTICLYCSFGSHRLDRFAGYVEPYFQALYRELRFISREMKGFRLDTVYIGGGTPTSVPAERLIELFGVLSDEFDMDSVREFTVEAGRPDTITEDKIRAMRDFHVDRISINPQTMNQNTLDLIGRQHTVSETVGKFRLAREAGFDNINMDMIVGLPGEGPEEVLNTLDEIEKLDPDSLTVHSLALKRATRLNLYKEEFEPVSFGNSDKIMNSTDESARRMGMTPYYLYRQKNMAGNFENVGYARPEKACLYNILIMEEKQTIMAAGSGASTKFVFDGGRRIERAENVKDLKNYIERIDEMCARKHYGVIQYLKGK